MVVICRLVVGSSIVHYYSHCFVFKHQNNQIIIKVKLLSIDPVEHMERKIDRVEPFITGNLVLVRMYTTLVNSKMETQKLGWYILQKHINEQVSRSTTQNG